MAANVALSEHLHPVSGSGRACQGQQERCVDTPKPDTVLNTARQSTSCNLGAGTRPELRSGGATQGLMTALCLYLCFCSINLRPETDFNRRHGDF